MLHPGERSRLGPCLSFITKLTMVLSVKTAVYASQPVWAIQFCKNVSAVAAGSHAAPFISIIRIISTLILPTRTTHAPSVYTPSSVSLTAVHYKANAFHVLYSITLRTIWQPGRRLSLVVRVIFFFFPFWVVSHLLYVSIQLSQYVPSVEKNEIQLPIIKLLCLTRPPGTNKIGRGP